MSWQVSGLDLVDQSDVQDCDFGVTLQKDGSLELDCIVAIRFMKGHTRDESHL